MGTITSGTGLISGLPISDLVDQLMSIEARPRDLASTQISQIDARKTAWLQISAKLLTLQSAAASFDSADEFDVVKATSSNQNVLTASADSTAAQGSYSITPVRLMTNHQVIAAGRADSDTSPVGAGTITVEFGHGELDPSMSLDFLNGQAGVARGSIRITDRSGASAVVDLTSAMTVSDVLDAINQTGTIAVQAVAKGDSIVLSDTSGSMSHDLTVAEVNNGRTAADLGLLGGVAANILAGDDLVSVNAKTSLAGLNDSNGVRTVAGNDMQITLADGTELLLDLDDVTTLGGVVNAINNHAGNQGKVTAAINSDAGRLTLTDASVGPGTLTVAAVGGSKAAFDLGLLGSDGDSDHLLTGGRLVGGLQGVLLRNLNGTAGVTGGTISVTAAGGGPVTLNLDDAQTLQDVIVAINDAGIAGLTASLNSAGNGIRVSDAGGGPLVISDVSGTLAQQLNIDGTAAAGAADSGSLQHRYISENTRLDSLGMSRGQFTITDSAGHSGTIDLTQGNETTLGDVMFEINTRGLGVVASINATGDGLLLTDTAGGAAKLTVAERGGTTAADLGLLGTDDGTDGKIDGSMEVKITLGAADTLKDLASAINAASPKLSAFVINDGTATDPFRLVVTSKVGGEAGRLVIDDGGLDLGLADMVRPQDAMLLMGDPSSPNSIAVRSTSNSFSNVLDGVTLTVTGTSAMPVQVTVAPNIDAMVTRINSFVTTFNDVIDNIDKATAFDPENNIKGVLQADGLLTQIRSRLFAMVGDRVADAPGKFSYLAQLGFSVTSKGTKLSFSDTKFRQAYASDPAAASGLFTQATTGVGARIQSVLKNVTDSHTGSISRQVTGLDGRRELLSDRVDSLNVLLETKRTRLLKQFQAMETALAQMQSQNSALSGLSSNLGMAQSAGIGSML